MVRCLRWNLISSKLIQIICIQGPIFWRFSSGKISLNVQVFISNNYMHKKYFRLLNLVLNFLDITEVVEQFLKKFLFDKIKLVNERKLIFSKILISSALKKDQPKLNRWVRYEWSIFYFSTCGGWVGLGGFNIGLELCKLAIANGLGLIPEDDPETCHHNFDPPRRGSACGGKFLWVKERCTF